MTDSDDAWLEHRADEPLAPLPELVLQLLQTVDDIGRVHAQINAWPPPDENELADLRAQLDVLQIRVKKEARDYAERAGQR